MAYSEETLKRSKEAVKLIYDGKIRNHKLKNRSFTHNGEAEETELISFKSFLPTKNCAIILALKGDQA